MSEPLIIANTGNGKGKTTAAMGMALRAVGHKKKTVIVQFIKHEISGEVKALQQLAPDLVEVSVSGLGFTWESDDLNKDKAAAQNGWKKAKEVLISGECDLLILDELTYTINYGFLDIDDVVDALLNRAGSMHVIITGRDLPEKLKEICNTVTEMGEIKHHFSQRIKSQQIIEY